MFRRVGALLCWAFGIWVLLTWTLTAEQLLFGAGVAAIVAVALAPLGEVAARGGCWHRGGWPRRRRSRCWPAAGSSSRTCGSPG